MVDGLRGEDGEELVDEEEGEGMVGFNLDVENGIGSAVSDRQRANDDGGGRRLSRDLEEGFRDDSDDESIRNVRRTARR